MAAPRDLVAGKVRRLILVAFYPGYVEAMAKRRRGSCDRCGRCCTLVTRCPNLEIDVEGRATCLDYENRTAQCRAFPIDQRDLDDLAAAGIPCCYSFEQGDVASGLGVSYIRPPIVGAWPWGKTFPLDVDIQGIAFRLAKFAWGIKGVVAQYRESGPYHSAHMYVYENGTYRIGHRDDFNPDEGHPVEHFFLDTVAGGLIAIKLGMSVLAAAIGWGLR